jgi:glucose-6-phosphate 1-dehydrogenase
MERIVIVGYKPLPEKSKELEDLLSNHWAVLNKEGLVTERKSILMRAADETVIEVFGWKSKEAMESAHANPVVQSMWDEFSKACEYVPIGNLEESKSLFSEFTPL